VTSTPLDRFREYLASLPDRDAVDGLFGELALAKKYVRDEELREAVREQVSVHGRGERVHLGQILIKRGLLSQEQFIEILAAQKGRLHACPSCGHVFELSGPAARNCPKCGTEAAAAADESTVVLPTGPVRIGKYQVVRELGRGAMGIVYEAEDVQLKRRVALKVLQIQDELPRFLREATLAGQLQHPNIAGVHEVGRVVDDAGHALHFIAMELVDGRTLAAVMRDSPPPRREMVRMIEDIARAVGHAHARGIIHRDLKPSNVLVEKHGRVVLTDFGLAFAEAGTTRLTASSSILGTPNYMSPEQADGRNAEIDARSDVWALGVMLYEVLAGRVPFHADTPAKLFHTITTMDPDPPSRGSTGVERDLEVVCMRALEKPRERRYANASEFAAELERWRKGEPILARPLGALERVYRRARRHPLLGTAAAMAVLLAGALVAIEGAYGANVDDEVKRHIEAARASTAQQSARLREALLERGLELADSARIKADLVERNYEAVGKMARYEVEYRSMPVDFLAVATHQGRTVARFASRAAGKTLEERPPGDGPEAPLVQRALADGDPESLDPFLVDGDRLYRAVAAPCLDGDLVRGVLVLGTEVTDAVAARIREPLAPEDGVAFVVDGRLLASSLGAQTREAAHGALAGRREGAFDAAIAGAPHHVVLTPLGDRVACAVFVSLQRPASLRARMRMGAVGLAGAIVAVAAIAVFIGMRRGAKA